MNDPLFTFAVRYSVLTRRHRSWNVSSDDLETYRKTLFDPLRLQTHRRLFERLTVPSLAAQAERGYADRMAVHVAASSELPLLEREELQRILAPYPWASIAFVGVDDRLPFDGMRDDFLPRKVKRAAAYAQCRLDDDDALSIHFLEHLEGYTAQRYADFIVSFGSGYALHFDAEADTILGAFDWYRPKNSVGMAHIGFFDRERTEGIAGRIFGLKSHSYADKARPLILDSREPLIIRAFHDQQDSPPRKRLEGEPADPEAIRARFSLAGVELPLPEQSRAFFLAHEEARREARRKPRGTGRYLGQIARHLMTKGEM